MPKDKTNTQRFIEDDHPHNYIDDIAWLELQVISAVTNIKDRNPQHPFVTAIRKALEEPEQLTLDL